jgi:hypothetical protein
MSTTTFRTTNVSVVAPYFTELGIIDSSLEASKNLTLAVERYIHALRYCFVSESFMFTCFRALRTGVQYTFFSDPT